MQIYIFIFYFSREIEGCWCDFYHKTTWNSSKLSFQSRDMNLRQCRNSLNKKEKWKRGKTGMNSIQSGTTNSANNTNIVILIRVIRSL